MPRIRSTRNRKDRITGAALAAALLLVAACSGVSPGPSPGPAPRQTPDDPGRPMAAILEQTIAAIDPMQHPFLNRERVPILARQLALQGDDPLARLTLTMKLAEEQLKAGDPEAAIALARPLLDPPADIRAFAPDTLALSVHEFLALCYLRLGEQENCIARHGVDSCLLPLRGTGIHTATRGSRGAIARLAYVLGQRPADLGARWLLNIAHMTLGEWPEKPAPAWLIPPAAFASEYEIGRFFDVAPAAGLAVRGLSGGVVIDDLDGDGRLDVLTSSLGLRDPLHLMRNAGEGKFVDITDAAGLAGLGTSLNLVQADYDNDGRVDVLVLRGAWGGTGGRLPNSLLRNLGGGRFEDVTIRAGLLSFHPTQVGAWADYDGDGDLDLFIGNESTPGDPHPVELYRNLGNGVFEERSRELGDPDLGFVKGAAWGDYNNDGRPNLYVSIQGDLNRLYRNDGERRPRGPRGEEWVFTEVAKEAGVSAPRGSFATWFFDYDNDGWLDLFVAGYHAEGIGDVAATYLGQPSSAEMPRLYRNLGTGHFADVTNAVRLDRVHLAMGANFGDLDNDGYPDIYLGTGEPSLRTLMPNRMFRNDRGLRFQDVTTAGGFGHLQKGHAIAFADIDDDGDQDVYEVMGGAFSSDVSQNVLFLNPGHGHRWLQLVLEGRRTNRGAIGARVRVRVRQGDGTRDIHCAVSSGGSFGANPLRCAMGLGGAEAIEEVEVLWPASGATQRFTGVAMDHRYRVIEGAAKLVAEAMAPFPLATPVTRPSPR